MSHGQGFCGILYDYDYFKNERIIVLEMRIERNYSLCIPLSRSFLPGGFFFLMYSEKEKREREREIRSLFT